MATTTSERHDTVSTFASRAIELEQRPGGVQILRNRLKPVAIGGTVPDRLRHWAQLTPDTVFLTEPAPGGPQSVTYGQAVVRIEALAARLAALPLWDEAPLAIVAGNSLNHALFMLAASTIGVPVAVVTPAYASAAAAPYVKFARVLETVTPALIVTDAPEAVEAALQALGSAIPVESLTDLSWLDGLVPIDAARLAALKAGVGPDTIAKLLLTSGSTGSPKPVINTHRMMVSNMEGLAAVWPFLEVRPPVLVDWLPWSHTFGGNCCFNLALFFGGTLHIDIGKPLPALVGRTLEALRTHAPSVYFNVPAGYEALLPALETDLPFAARFFSGLEFLFNAAAALPASTRQRLEQAALAAIGRCPPIIGAWGATETAPFATVIYFDTPHSGNLGVPLPGVDIKLQPLGGRTELRVLGPNVTPGYWRQPEATSAAFDEDGFYCIGDAGKLIDPNRPELGIIFDGRIAENFKLASGTWVNVGALRLSAIAAARPLVSDAVVAGEGRDALGLLIFPNEAACLALLDEAGLDAGDRHPALHPEVLARIRDGLRGHNAAQTGSSTQVSVFEVLTAPPQPEHDEITEKGYINQRGVLSRSADAVEALYRTGQGV